MKKTVTDKGETCLYLTGEIVSDNDLWIYQWLDIEAFSPSELVGELTAAAGAPLLIRVNSPGGDLIAGVAMYTELMSYNGRIAFEITGLAASAATVMVMASAKAGNTCRMSPAALMMIHNVVTVVEGDYREMDKGAEQLRTANQAIVAAYKLKTGLSEEELQQMMDAETWFSAEEALVKKLIDEILFTEGPVAEPTLQNLLKSPLKSMYNSLPRLSAAAINKMRQLRPAEHQVPPEALDISREKELINIEKIRFGG